MTKIAQTQPHCKTKIRPETSPAQYNDNWHVCPECGATLDNPPRVVARIEAVGYTVEMLADGKLRYIDKEAQ